MNKRKKWLYSGVLLVIIVSLAACKGRGKSISEQTVEEQTIKEQAGKNIEEKKFIPEVLAAYEAEEASLSGNVKSVAGGKAGYSGMGYVEGFQEDKDTCNFRIKVEEDGFYDLNFVSASSGGEKYNYISVDEETMGTVLTEKPVFSDSILKRVYMSAGEHEVRLTKYWGWIYLDKLEILTSQPVDPAIYKVDNELVNPDASKEAKELYAYLCGIYGNKILSGQYCETGQNGKEFHVIKEATGKTPAVLGMDLIDYSPTSVKNGTKGYTVDFAKDFHESGGIVTFCWHWTVPDKYLTGTWNKSFYTEHTNIDLAKIMNGEDPEGYELLMGDMDAIAKELKELKEAGVPVLFRPLHEASGGWFWWGAAGPEAYIKLYIVLYEKLTVEHGLNNLIWVWNGQATDWYPGDNYVDIIGEDIYPGERVYTSQAASYFNAATSYSKEAKLVYMTENGCVFDPKLAKRDGAMWGMWCTWEREFVAKDSAIFALSEQYTEKSMLISAYEDEDVLTLEDLPGYQVR